MDAAGVVFGSLAGADGVSLCFLQEAAKAIIPTIIGIATKEFFMIVVFDDVKLYGGYPRTVPEL
jgi:hypothetical protein